MRSKDKKNRSPEPNCVKKVYKKCEERQSVKMLISLDSKTDKENLHDNKQRIPNRTGNDNPNPES